MIKLFNKLLNNKANKPTIFYIRGFRRSGTNWVCNLLNLHPDIICKGEFHFQELFLGKEKMHTLSYKFNDNNKFNFEFQEFVDQVIIEKCNDAPFCGDRTPTKILNMVVKNRKYFLVTRDGRDCMVSWFYHCLRINHMPTAIMRKKKRLFDADPNYFEKHPFELLEDSVYFEKIAKLWCESIISDLECFNKQKELGIECIWIKYEDLLNNVDFLRNKMFDFLGVDKTKAINIEGINLPGFKKHDPLSHNRKGEAGRWEKYFTPTNKTKFESIAINALELIN